MQKVFLIGSPVKHSLSPVIHNAAYQELGLDYEFGLAEVQSQNLSDYIKQLSPEAVGLAVTMPHKHSILPCLDAVEPMAATLQVVNTVVVTGSMRTGFNTDVYGIRKSLENHSEFAQRYKTQQIQEVLILGAGATAVSAMMAAAELGIKNLKIIARSFTRPPSIMKIATTLGLRPVLIPLKSGNRVQQELMQASVIISTIPSDVLSELLANAPLVREKIVLNIDYSHETSSLQQQLKDTGNHYIPGTEVLLHQAVSQFSLHTGKPAPASAMRAAMEAALSERN
ncbi:shikimate dehydrogenase [Gleimia coleocanis DSM 15436]|uniref:Shikimate dehydrogenase n=1 Tax=Gleimia coleocanis DSM 15436 TaxID=525245 RepID=C0W1M9_9ACTO|nr:shikimate dehydrogenase [Gleimia coleocanis]EEH63395.1 shikimate dehydrogenase [Gleimia coleocanis DSM 15436]